MALLDSTVGLIYSLRADDSEARKSVSDLRKHIDDETSRIESDSQNAFLSLGKSIGLTDSQIVSLGKSLPVVGAVAAGIAGLGAAYAVTAVKIFDLTKQVADAGTEISRFSTLTGFTVETVGALKIAAEGAGTSIDEIEEVFESFVELMIEGGQGAEDAKDKIKSLGLDPQTAFKDLEGSFLKTLDKIREMPTQAGKAKVAMDGMGESGLNMIKVAEGMTGGTTAYIAKLKEMGVVMDKDGIAQSKEFNKNLGHISLQAQGVANTFVKEFMPTITGAMKDVGGWIQNNKGVISDWGRFVKSEILTLIDLINKLRTAWQAFKDFGSQYGGVVGAMIANNQPGGTPPTSSPVSANSKEIGYVGNQDGFLIDPQKQREAAEKAAKEQQAATDKLQSAQKQSLEQSFKQLAEITRKNYEDKLITAEKFRNEVLENERQFRTKLIQLTLNEFDVLAAQEKNKTAKQALEIKRRAAIEQIHDESDARIAESEKLITDSEKKITDEKKNEAEKRVKVTEEEAGRVVALDKASSATRIAQLNLDLRNKTISERAYVEAINKIRLDVLEKEKKEVESLEQNAQTRQRIKLLDEEIAQQKIQNALEVIGLIERETEALEKQRQAQQDFYDAQNAIKANKRPGEGLQTREEENGGFLNGIIGGLGISIEQMMEKVEPLKGIGNIIGAQFNAIASAVGNAVKAFVLFGSAGGGFKKFAAEMLATIAQMAIVQSIWELAQGFAMLALSWFTGNPKYAASAGAHFTAAAIYGAVGGVAAIAGRAVAGDSFNQQAGTGDNNPATGNGNSRNSSGGGAYSSFGDDTRVIEQGANSPSGRGGEFVFSFKGDKGVFEDWFDVAFHSNGKVRRILNENYST